MVSLLTICWTIFVAVECSSETWVAGQLKNGSIDSNESLRVFGRQKRDDIETDEEALCKAFVDGDDHEFFSPDYPNTYPKDIDCLRVIEAPKNHLVKLDFRGEFFEVERTDGCKFDSLEVRDGGYGFSTVIGTFCGSEFPPMIISTNRFLYLRFRSDKNIQLRGFRAVYDFVPRPTTSPPEMDDCVFEYTNFTGVINNTDIADEMLELSETSSASLDCLWKISVEPGFKISLIFVTYTLTFPNECTRNFIDIFGDTNQWTDKTDKHFCGSAAEGLNSATNVHYIRFFAESAAIHSKFSITYTAFRERLSNQTCKQDDEFDCQDNSCISQQLRCDGTINCRYKWDELECQALEEDGLPKSIVIIMSGFSVGFLILIVALIVKCVRKLRKDAKKIHEHLQASRCDLNRIHSRDNLRQSLPSMMPVMAVSMLPPSPPSPPRQSNSSSSDGHNHYDESSHVVAAMLLHTTSVGTITDDLENGVESSNASSNNVSGHNVCNSSCQTRESLFQTIPILPVRPIERASTPEARYRAQVAISVYKADEGEQKTDSFDSEHSSAKSSAHVRLQPKIRPFSVQSTKSAPDVIVNH